MADLSLLESSQRPVRLLIVDDDTQICQMFSRYLSLKGYEVRSVNRGEEALALATVFQPQVVLLDLLMAGMSGVDTLKRLKQLTPPPKVIMLSGANTDDVAHGAIQLGADAFVTKPVKLPELEHLLSAFWQTKK